MTAQVRQGDVFLRPTTARPTEAAQRVPLDAGRLILAYGEVTGHAHAVVDATTRQLPSAQMCQEPDGSRFLLVERPCALIHEEHGTIPLSPGAYRVIRQREYSPEEIRTVAD
jgi:hypothetical protein